MDVFRVFDSVNYLPNLQLGIEVLSCLSPSPTARAVSCPPPVLSVLCGYPVLPSLRSMCSAQAVGAAGGISEGTICYSGNVLRPRANKYTLDYYLQLGRDLVKVACLLRGVVGCVCSRSVFVCRPARTCCALRIWQGC
jgi:hypothetical protein